MLWQALAALSLAHGRRLSWRDLAQHAAQVPEEVQPEVAVISLQAHGLSARVRTIAPDTVVPTQQLPVAVRLQRNQWVLLVGAEGEQVRVRRVDANGDLGVTERWPHERLRAEHDGLLVVVDASTAAPADMEPELAETMALAQPPAPWFWGVFARLRPHYGDCVLAAVLINLLSLAGSMFSMNVYDRVIPNAALNSLWTLAVGVLLAAVLEFGLRMLRAHVLDDAGKRADLALSAAIFRQTLNLRPADRPQASGHWASQLREFESVRDFVSSSTLVALTDLPFTVLFLVVIGWMGGALVWVTLVAAVLIVVVAVLTQLPIRHSIEQYQYENTQKHAFLIEAFERLETIDALGAEPALQGRWERLCASAARSAMGTRMASALTLNAAQFVQQLGNVMLIVVGVYLITAGQITVGALIGCSILASRALSPLSQVAALMARWQHTRQSFRAVERFMQLPLRHDPGRTFVRWPASAVGTPGECAMQLESLSFRYPRTEVDVLRVDRLHFKMGETVAVTGAVGSGKSTLLRVLAGLLWPTQGRMLVGSLAVGQISPAEWRAHVAWVGQDCVMFRGSLRENLLMAAPQVSDERLLYVLRLCGIDRLAASHPMGLDMPLGEGGQALSGGQRQWVALARALLADAPVLLLDEPTSAMDMAGEHQLLERLREEFRGRLVVLATHRPGPLALADRMVVLDAGQVVADGPRDLVLKALHAGQVARADKPQGKTDTSVQRTHAVEVVA